MPNQKKVNQMPISINQTPNIKPSIIKKTEPTLKKTNTKTQIPRPERNPLRKKTEYKYAGKKTLSQIIGKAIPKAFVPTERIAPILGFIFLIVIILALVLFPYDKLLSGDADVVVEIGYPLPFLELGVISTDSSPLRPKGLFIDIILYLLLAYAIDVTINLILGMKLLKSKEELLKKPKVFKSRKSSIANKITRKIFSRN